MLQKASHLSSTACDQLHRMCEVCQNYKIGVFACSAANVLHIVAECAAYHGCKSASGEIYLMQPVKNQKREVCSDYVDSDRTAQVTV
jgi:hypothetical protein